MFYDERNYSFRIEMFKLVDTWLGHINMLISRVEEFKK
jgi:hypothetical protein